MSEDPIFAAEEARKSGKGAEKGEEERDERDLVELIGPSFGNFKGMSFTSNKARDERDEKRLYAPPLTRRRRLKPELNTWLA